MSFRAKIVAGIALIQIVLLGLFVGSSVSGIRSSNMDAARDHATAAADLFAHAVKDPVLSSDLATLQEVTDGLALQAGLTFVRVTSPLGVILAEAGAVQGGREHEGRTLIATANVLAGGQAFGVIEIGLSTAAVDRAVADALRIFAAIAAFGIALTAAVAVVLSRYLRRRLDVLEAGAREVAAGALGYQIADGGPDELGRVAEAFNRMSAQLRSAYGELADSNSRFQAIARNIPGAVYQRVVEADGKSYLTFISKGVEGLLGATPQQLINSLDIMRRIIHPDDVEAYFRALERSVSQRVPFSVEYRVSAPDGTVKWVRVEAGIRNRADGAAVFDGLMLDVTRDKEIETIKNEFVSIVNHELRTPLTSIQGSLALIAHAPPDAVQPRYRAMVDIAYRNCDRLARLVNDILDMEKIASGKMTLSRAPREVADLIGDALEATHPFAESLGKTVTALDALPGVAVEVDGDRIVQVLTNLISNAVKFEPDGGAVEVAVMSDVGKVRFAVTDHGPGIPADFRDRIFEKFSQAENTLTRKHEGTGLGLAISKALVEAHGGELGFYSAPFERTTFWFELPSGPKVTDGAATAAANVATP